MSSLTPSEDYNKDRDNQKHFSQIQTVQLRSEAENMIHTLRHADTPAAVCIYGSQQSHYHNPPA